MSLCLAYVGGPGAVEVKMNGVVLVPSWWAGTCCLPPLPVNGRFVRYVKQGALQFVLVIPILAALTMVLFATDHYEEGNWSPAGGYLYITILYNITYSVALYALLLFYLGTHELLEPFRPLLKFVLVKSVVFLTFWQGFFIAIGVGVGVVASPEEGSDIQAFLICCEMLPAALAMVFAFPYQDFKDGAGGLRGGNFTHAISIRDLVADTVHQFAPQYNSYVLYSDGAVRKASNKGGAAGQADSDDAPARGSDDADLLGNVEMGAATEWVAVGGKERGAEPETAGRDKPSPEVGRSKYLSKEEEDVAAASARASPAPRPWDNVTLDSPPRAL
jgi:hypothetical protein